MTPTPPASSNHSPIEQHLSNNHGYRVVRKRNRVPLSCGPCRSRKLKCNRQTPCENCVRRNDASGCTYATSTHSSRNRKQSASSSGGGSSDEMQSRIDRLEGLVLSLMSGNSNNVSPRNHHDELSSSSGARASSYPDSRDDEEEDDDAMGYDEHDEHGELEGCSEGRNVEADVEEVRNALGIMKVTGGKTYYRGETHWAAILSEITEVKKYFDETKQKYEEELATMRCATAITKLQATGFPFSASRPPSKQEILDLIPKKPVVDRLVDCYFRNYDPIFHVLHRPSFYRQYEDFWREPSSVDILWLGLLMVVMSIATKVYSSGGEIPPELFGRTTVETWHAYRSTAEQCLIVGEYTKKPYLHTVQTMILLAVSLQGDNTWIFCGMVIRVAMSMGLHRDPNQFPDITPGEGEVRRRLWTMITCMDLLTSVQIGLPCMIKEDECDTKLPLNLHDDEISEKTTVLPPGHGKDELTGVSYMIYKARMAHTLWEVIRQVQSVKARPPYDEVMKLEAEIHKRYSQVPNFLKLKTPAQSVNDPAWLIIQRYSLDILHQLSILTLHRPYAAKYRLNLRFLHSYEEIVQAAMTLLRHQDEIFTLGETTLRHARWFTDFQGIQEFLQAAMVVSLHLFCPCGDSPLEPGLRKERLAALIRARDINAKLCEVNPDANKAHGVISVMLEKINRDENTNDEHMRKHSKQQPKSKPLSSFERRLASLAATPNRPPDFMQAASTKDTCDPTLPLKSAQAASITLGGSDNGGILAPGPTFASLFERPVVSTPGGTLMLPDAAPSTPGTLDTVVPPPAVVMSPPGWNALWSAGSPMGFDMSQGSEWDEWDDFMKGIDLDTSTLGGFPVMPGIGMYPPPTAQERLEKRQTERGGGVGGGGGRLEGL